MSYYLLYPFQLFSCIYLFYIGLVFGFLLYFRARVRFSTKLLSAALFKKQWWNGAGDLPLLPLLLLQGASNLSQPVLLQSRLLLVLPREAPCSVVHLMKIKNTRYFAYQLYMYACVLYIMDIILLYDTWIIYVFNYLLLCRHLWRQWMLGAVVTPTLPQAAPPPDSL